MLAELLVKITCIRREFDNIEIEVAAVGFYIDRIMTVVDLCFLTFSMYWRDTPNSTRLSTPTLVYKL